MKTKQVHQTNTLILSKVLSLLTFILGLSVLTACSAVKFSTKSNCGNDTNCVSQAGSDVYGEGIETITGGKVDILFVNDNSASMSYEQTKLSEKFNQFISKLDGSFVDYRIAVTTTDISSAQNAPRTINQGGALQDGKLISFSNSQKYLTPSSGTTQYKEQLFNSVIKRQETISCEQFIKNWAGSRDTLAYSQSYYNACPSTDERGIFAANLVIQNNSDNFIRQEADLAVIFLADEDERSQMYWHNIAGFELADFDKASTLVNQIKSKYPQKTHGIHAFIVKDQNCLNMQNAQTNGLVSGSFGWEYYNATVATGGIAGDICSNDYTQPLLNIFSKIQGNIVDKIALKCSEPELETEYITITSSDPSITSFIVGSEIRFTKKLPVGSTVKYKYRCVQSAK